MNYFQQFCGPDIMAAAAREADIRLDTPIFQYFPECLHGFIHSESVVFGHINMNFALQRFPFLPG